MEIVTKSDRQKSVKIFGGQETEKDEVMSMGRKRKKHLFIIISVLILTFADIPQTQSGLRTQNIPDGEDLLHMGVMKTYAAKTAVNNTCVRILGYRYNVKVNGYGVVYGIEPAINKKSVMERGLIYGASFMGATESRMTINDNSSQTYKMSATLRGEISEDYEISGTMKYYAVTMINNGEYKEAIDASYMVRAYAVLEDGSVIYSSIYHYSIYKICNSLYKNCYMEDEISHEWIYEHILKVSNPEYKPVEYSWGAVVTP